MKLTLNPTDAVETRRASRELWRTAGKRRRAIRPPLAVGERILLWLRLALHPHKRHTILDRFVILWVLDFDLYAHHLCLTVASGESVCSIAQRRYSMNSKDCGMTAAEEYIAALITVVLLFRIHCHMDLTVLEISHSLPNQVRISFNLANFAWSPPAICLI